MLLINVLINTVTCGAFFLQMVRTGIHNLELSKTFATAEIMSIIGVFRSYKYFPLDPTTIYGGVQVEMVAAGTFILGVLKGRFWS